MKHFFLLWGLAGMTAVAAPVVSDVSMTLNSVGSTATVSYKLTGGPAIVTVDIQTNGVSLTAEDFGRLSGDLNGVFEDGQHLLKWRPSDRFIKQGIRSIDAKAIVTAWSLTKGPDYLVADLDGKTAPCFHADAAHVPGGVTNDIYKTDKLLLKFIPAANVEWYMGSPMNEPDRIGWNVNEDGTPKPLPGGQTCANYSGEALHKVRLTHGYYMGVYEVTQGQYEKVTKTNPAWFNGDVNSPRRPVERVAYTALRDDGWPGKGRADCGDKVLKKFRTATGLDLLDLPTEAEWEFACRAGVTAPFSNGRWMTGDKGGGETNGYTCPDLDEIARYWGNGGMLASGGGSDAFPPQNCSTNQGTAVVGSFKPNAFGLYDMHGNVSEWVLDYASYGVDTNAVVDPVGPSSGEVAGTRLLKGGAFYHAPRALRSAARRFQGISGDQRWFGFRLCLPL